MHDPVESACCHIGAHPSFWSDADERVCLSVLLCAIPPDHPLAPSNFPSPLFAAPMAAAKPQALDGRTRADVAPMDLSQVRITLQFHPNWPCVCRRSAAASASADASVAPAAVTPATPTMTTVLESLLHDGAYLSQFVTQTSNGGLSAHPGGDRWRWESRLFAGRYDGDAHHHHAHTHAHAAASRRPVYGAVHDRAEPHGASIRFGSCFLRLRPEVTARATFCYPGLRATATQTKSKQNLLR
jgi:hypothetical protein